MGATEAVPLGVIDEPELSCHKLHPDDRFVIIGSEGVWQVLSCAEAVRIAWDVLRTTAKGGSGAVGKPLPALGSGTHVLPPLVSNSPTVHGAESPYVECVTAVSPPADGGAPVSGMGGGSAAVLDLTHGILDPAVRASRLKRRRVIALAAAERILQQARTRWATRTAAGRACDVSVMVVMLEW